MPAAKWFNDEDVLTEGRKYASRREFCLGSNSAYKAAIKRNLLDLLYPSTHRDWSNDEDVLAEGRKYASRGAFAKACVQAYKIARQRNLLDQLYPAQRRDWSNDEDVLAEGRKYASRDEFQRSSCVAYAKARKRKLLDQLYPSKRRPRENDTIYIWRAVGQHYNGNPVYKIGVTGVSLGIARVEWVSRKSGFEFDLICCEQVQCKATELERKLHLLGESPGYTGFDGCTEFRALSDSALYAAISMICNQL